MSVESGVLVAFHGADGDTILAIVETRALRPRHGLIFLGSSAQTTYVHGVDLRRRAAFSLELRLGSQTAGMRRIATPGSPITIRIDTDQEVPIEIVVLHVRRPSLDGWTEEIIPARDIERYLCGAR